MFPVTDDSRTITGCFLEQIKRNKISLKLSTRVTSWTYDSDHWTISLFNDENIKTHHLLIASGSDQRIWNALKASGHSIIAPVPSLFTFNIADSVLHELKGISKSPVNVSLPAFGISAEGPLLITHWGLSGPAILKLSAWGARDLFICGYVFDLQVNWTPGSLDEVLQEIQKGIAENSKKYIVNLVIPEFPSRLWKYICKRAEIPEFMSGAEFGKKPLKRLQDVLTKDTYRVTGKSTYKDEFVTAGGVDLGDIELKTFESKKQSGLFLAGEVLNIDALTGGFNFQAAWTAAFIVAEAVSKRP
jgi:predicted Rossmann fold flavoprotein